MPIVVTYNPAVAAFGLSQRSGEGLSRQRGLQNDLALRADRRADARLMADIEQNTLQRSDSLEAKAAAEALARDRLAEDVRRHTATETQRVAEDAARTQRASEVLRRAAEQNAQRDSAAMDRIRERHRLKIEEEDRKSQIKRSEFEAEEEAKRRSLDDYDKWIDSQPISGEEKVYRKEAMRRRGAVSRPPAPRRAPMSGMAGVGAQATQTRQVSALPSAWNRTRPPDYNAGELAPVVVVDHAKRIAALAGIGQAMREMDEQQIADVLEQARSWPAEDRAALEQIARVILDERGDSGDQETADGVSAPPATPVAPSPSPTATSPQDAAMLDDQSGDVEEPTGFENLSDDEIVRLLDAAGLR